MRRSLSRRWRFAGCCLLVITLAALTHRSAAGPFRLFGGGHHNAQPVYEGDGGVGGTWLWSCSPEEERRIIAGLYNRYCIRCHGVDGRGAWDVPGVPSFADPRWQAHRSDAQIVRVLVEGRGAIMPAFRGTLSLDEDWAMARYLRTFVPGAETPPPYRRGAEKDVELPPPTKIDR